MRTIPKLRAGTLLVSLLAAAAFAQGSAVLTGNVTDAATGKPVPDVVVTATSPGLQGEEIVVTDAAGLYRIPQLPPGTFSIRLEKESFRPYSRQDIQLRVDRTVRLNIQLQPESLKAEEVVVVGRPPTIDVGSSTTGVNVGQDFLKNIAIVRPGAKRSGTRSFESLAEAAPGVNGDDYGFSVAGTTSPENQFVIDGLSVNDPAFGLLGTPLSVEFVQDVNVITGGYMPEYGRATGGVMNVVTKSGSNEFHGSVFGNWSPGVLEGSRPDIKSQSTSIRTKVQTWNVGDFGAEVGGPILKDKLWFFAGFNPSFSRYRETRKINRFTDSNGDGKVSAADVDANGDRTVEELPGTSKNYFADARSYQFIGKLTYLINSDHNVSLSVIGAPTSSGGPGQAGIDPKLGGVDNLGPGAYSALASKYTSNANDISLKYAAAFLDKRVLLDVTLGYHRQENSPSVPGATSPTDGSKIGDTTGVASVPHVTFRRTNKHSILDFEALNPEAAALCDPAGTANATKCPVSSYVIGGPGFMDSASLERYQGRAVGTLLLSAAGHHVIKAGVDIELLNFTHTKGEPGGVSLRESAGGGSFFDARQYGYLTAPDTAVILDKQVNSVRSTSIGGFLQDSWNIVDLVTLNAGLRVDQQTLFGADGNVGLTLNNQISPRVGLVYDFTQSGRSKIFANYARFYEGVPLDIADRDFPPERQVAFSRTRVAGANGNGNLGCDPLKDINQVKNQCQDPKNYQQLGGTTEPSQFGLPTGGPLVPVDPNLQPQSTDEIVAGGEYELIADGRIGVNYTHRVMNNVIEDMSRDEAATYFIGNPGSGLAADFPKATRDYDAVTVFFNKAFSDLWLAQVSYTWSYLRGNYAGLFRPETDQLDPNINSDFDLISLLPNRTGPLPGDRTHVIKVFGAKEFVITGSMSFNVGLTYKARSGNPISYLGSHVLYGADEVFVLPRGSGGRTPWVHTVDARAGFNYKFTKDNVLQVSVDIFNMFNFAAVTAVDETFTNTDVAPVQVAAGTNPQQAICIAGSDPKCKASALHSADGTPLTLADLNTNFKNAAQYQAPLTVRFGVRVTF